MRSLVNSEDPDEMPHNAAFYQGLHRLLLQKTIFSESNTFLRPEQCITAIIVSIIIVGIDLHTKCYTGCLCKLFTISKVQYIS